MFSKYINSKIFSVAVLTLLFFSNQAQSDSSFEVDSTKNIIPVFTTTVDLLDNELQSQDISGLLQSSRDVYVNQAWILYKIKS